MPIAPPLALRGLHPNPSVGRFAVSFQLPSGSHARLAVLDVSGRRVLSRELGALDAGTHVVTLDGTALAPGVYMVRLTQDGLVVSGKVTIVH